MQQIEHTMELETEKVLIVGIDNAGKSSIQDILRFTSAEAAFRRSPSRDLELFNKEFLKRNYIFFIPPGQEDLRRNELHGSMKNEYFSDVSTLILVVDSTDTHRFLEVQEELQKTIEDLLELSPKCSNFILFAHKQDLADAVDSMEIKRKIVDPLRQLYPGIVNQFIIYETSILDSRTIHEPFIKAIAKHIGTNRVDFDALADWVREQAKARIVLITDANGLLIGESYVGHEDSLIYAAYMAKIFSAVEDFEADIKVGGIKIVVLEEENEIDYSVISRINCSKKDYLAMLIGYPKAHMGMSKLINKKGLQKLKVAFENYNV